MKLAALFHGWRAVLLLALRGWAAALFIAALLLALPCRGGQFADDFSGEPSQNWRVFGNAGLFIWTNNAVEVQWDSDQPNSYFYHRLPGALTKLDDFSASVDLLVHEVSIELTGPFAFEIAFGFFNEASATNAAFRRGTGRHSPNLVEWDYFPDTGFGPTLSRAVASTNSSFIVVNDFPVELAPGAYRITLSYSGADGVLRTDMQKEGEPFATLKPLVLPASFTDFEVNAFGFMSYHDGSASGRLVARAIVDNVRLEWGASDIHIHGAFVGGGWEVSFNSAERFRYQLERSGNLVDWFPVGDPQNGSGGLTTLRDSDPPSGRAFYRVRIVQ